MEGDGPADCVIEVAALGDIERFRHPRDFKEDATHEALNAFDQLLIDVTGQHLKVRLRFARTAHGGRSRFDTGVVLEVHSPGTASPENLTHARKVVAAAVSRGSGPFTRMVVGDDSTDLPLDSAFRSAHWESQRKVGLAAVFLFVAAFYVGFLVVTGWLGEFAWNSIALPLVVGVVGALSFAFFVRWVPSVDVAETATGERIQRLTAEISVTILGALVGAMVSLVLGV